MPSFAVWREKRAGHLVTAGAREAPNPAPLENLLLAGDWLDLLRPANLESATMNGHAAADIAIARLGPYGKRDQPRV